MNTSFEALHLGSEGADVGEGCRRGNLVLRRLGGKGLRGST